MAGKKDKIPATPRIENRRALHDYTITARLECGVVLLGSEVKSLRLGHAQLTDSFARVEDGQLVLYQCHIDPYVKAAGMTHEPKRPRVLLAHRREIHRLETAMDNKGTTLVALSIYFKEGRAKVEIGVGEGRQSHDKRAAIRRKEQDRDMRRATTTFRR